MHKPSRTSQGANYALRFWTLARTCDLPPRALIPRRQPRAKQRLQGDPQREAIELGVDVPHGTVPPAPQDHVVGAAQHGLQWWRHARLPVGMGVWAGRRQQRGSQPVAQRAQLHCCGPHGSTELLTWPYLSIAARRKAGLARRRCRFQTSPSLQPRAIVGFSKWMTKGSRKGAQPLASASATPPVQRHSQAAPHPPPCCKASHATPTNLPTWSAAHCQ